MIESYDFGRIVIDERKLGRGVVIFPDRIDMNWWRREAHTLSVDDVKEFIEAKPEVLVIGTGHSGLMKIHPEPEQHPRSSGIELITAKTEKTVQDLQRAQVQKSCRRSALNLLA